MMLLQRSHPATKFFLDIWWQLLKHRWIDFMSIVAPSFPIPRIMISLVHTVTFKTSHEFQSIVGLAYTSLYLMRFSHTFFFLFVAFSSTKYKEETELLNTTHETRLTILPPKTGWFKKTLQKRKFNGC